MPKNERMTNMSKKIIIPFLLLNILSSVFAKANDDDDEVGLLYEEYSFDEFIALHKYII
jgi:hypothetical protein